MDWTEHAEIILDEMNIKTFSCYSNVSGWGWVQGNWWGVSTQYWYIFSYNNTERIFVVYAEKGLAYDIPNNWLLVK